MPLESNYEAPLGRDRKSGSRLNRCYGRAIKFPTADRPVRPSNNLAERGGTFPVHRAQAFLRESPATLARSTLSPSAAIVAFFLRATVVRVAPVRVRGPRWRRRAQ